MGMDDSEGRNARIAAYYDQLVARFGHDPRSCDYGRATSQIRKFEVMAQVMDLESRSVLDVGCGFADFADYLRGRFKDVHYSGVDITPAMVKTARELHPDLTIHQGDILAEDFAAPYDLVTANGIFYLMGEGAEAIMRRIVARMYQLSRKAVAFNSLSTWAPEQEAGEFYADPAATLEFCRTLTPFVTLRHDYLRHDFTVFLYREQAGGA
jgi:SAM-dependent methyltransferase